MTALPEELQKSIYGTTTALLGGPHGGPMCEAWATKKPAPGVWREQLTDARRDGLHHHLFSAGKGRGKEVKDKKKTLKKVKWEYIFYIVRGQWCEEGPGMETSGYFCPRLTPSLILEKWTDSLNNNR